MEVMGLPPKRMLDQATRKKMFFGATGSLSAPPLFKITIEDVRRFEREPTDCAEFAREEAPAQNEGSDDGSQMQ